MSLARKDLAKSCRSVEDIQELLKDLFKDTIQECFEAELDEHLGYEKNTIEGNNSGNSRNGYYKKMIKSSFGTSEVEIPRDRNGGFKPLNF